MMTRLKNREKIMEKMQVWLEELQYHRNYEEEENLPERVTVWKWDQEESESEDSI
jgi:hypothetical protein